MSVRDAIVDWSASQPLWRRDLLRRVAARGADDHACREVLDLLLGQHGLAPAAPAAVPLTRADLPDDAPARPAVLHQIGECSNVNAIESRNPLTFEPAQITLVYGPNGVGKSSYTRIIKRIAHSASEEPVLGNVFSRATTPPRAVIEIEDEHGRRKHIVPLADERQPLLESMTVFDDRCASVYLRNEKTVAFTPTPLRIFGRAAAAQRRIKELLDERIEALVARRPSFDAFPPGTKVRLALDALSASSTTDDVAELATLEAEEVERHAQAKLELAAVDAGAVETQARQRERDAQALGTLATELERAADTLSPDAAARVTDARKAVREAEQAAALARSKSLANEPRATGGEAWLRMWEAARTFVELECDHEFPPTDEGSACPFCRQVLSDESRDRLQRLDDFVRNTLDDQLQSAHTKLEDELGRLSSDPLDRALASQGLALLRDEQPELASRIVSWLDSAAARYAAIKAGHDAQALPPSDTDVVRDLATGRQAEAAHQRLLVNPDLREALRQTVVEGDARLRLRDRLKDVQEWHQTLSTIAALERVRKELDTTSLSNKQTELARQLVTEALRDAVRQELDALGFSHVKADLSCRSDRGTTVARMRIGETRLLIADVLSAGEQQACALAFFLAEARTSTSSGGLVFDDPTAAFDVERVEHIADRLVGLAAQRQQLIVFSCDVVFAWFLQAAAEAKGISFAVRPIARMGDKVGIVRPSQAWPGETLKARLARLRDELQTLEAHSRRGEIDAYEASATAFAGDVRAAWERAIEEELFGGVVMRFQRDVKVLRLRKVVVTAELTSEVLDAMDETSPYHHDPALAKPVPTPSAAELRRFLERLEDFCARLKKKKTTEQRVA